MPISTPFQSNDPLLTTISGDPSHFVPVCLLALAVVKHTLLFLPTCFSYVPCCFVHADRVSDGISLCKEFSSICS